MREGYVYATCTECGHEFERFRAQPYLTLCPACRKALKKSGRSVMSVYVKKETRMEKKRHIRCRCCEEHIAEEAGLGIWTCPHCKNQWWSMGQAMPGTWIDRSGADGNVYRKAELVGTFAQVIGYATKVGIRKGIDKPLSVC